MTNEVACRFIAEMAMAIREGIQYEPIDSGIKSETLHRVRQLEQIAKYDQLIRQREQNQSKST